MEDKVKKHGCICPFHPFQLGSYVIFLIKGISFYAVSSIAMGEHPGAQASICVVYSVLLGIVVIFTFVATLSDPTDPTVYFERKQKNNK